MTHKLNIQDFCKILQSKKNLSEEENLEMTKKLEHIKQQINDSGILNFCKILISIKE